ncbi:MAG: EpsG family protein [Facklamia hominis]
MTIYEYNIIFITLYAILSNLIQNKKIRRFLFIMFSSTHLFFVQGFRSIYVGGDLLGYKVYYNSTDSIREIFHGQFEVGYNLISYICNSLGINFQFFICIISLFTFVVLSIYLFKNSKNVYMSYGLYLYFGIYDFGFSGLRQMIAMTIILISFEYLLNKKLIKFIICTLIATSFHTTAISFLLIYPLVNIQTVSKLYTKVYVITLPFLIYFGSIIVYGALNWFQPFLLRNFNFNYLDGFGMDEIFIIIIYIAGVIMIFIDKNNKENELFYALYIISTITLAIQLLSPFSYYFTRFNLYFYQFLIIYFPLLYEYYLSKLFKHRKISYLLIKIISLSIFFIGLLIFYHNYIQTNPHLIVPHSFF